MELVAMAWEKLKSTVLMALHHGSGRSSSKVFLNQVNPEVVMISCGWKNPFQFPRPSVLSRYEKLVTYLIQQSFFFHHVPPFGCNVTFCLKNRVEDGEPLSEKLLRSGVDFIIKNKEAERKVLVARGAGISRSTVFAIASLKEIENKSLLDAYQVVKQHHLETMPHPSLWKSLCNYYNEDVSFSELMGF